MTHTPVHSRSVLVIAGPTAGGKSGLALAVAEAFGGTVINADSMQVYRELRVLTARPPAADEARVPHRLYGELPAAERCSAGRWLDLAAAEVRAAWDAGRLPIVVGGTGLYLKALREGLSPIPPVPEETRQAARALYDELGGEAFRARLAERDPAAAARLPAADRQRLARAWEVVEATGRPLSAWQAVAPRPPLPEARFRALSVMPARPWLHARIARRFDAMIADGALDEVRALDALGLDPSLPAMKALGVPELRRVLHGAASLAAAADQVRAATRRYAKRQVTWLRHQMPDATPLGEQFLESPKHEKFSFIRQFLLTTPH